MIYIILWIFYIKKYKFFKETTQQFEKPSTNENAGL